MSRLDEDPNVYRVGYNRALDFCVWALERDGLQVRPFDRHREGTGALRDVGLDATGWAAWVEAVTEATVRRAASQLERSRLLDRAAQPYSDRMLAFGRELAEAAREADRSRRPRAARLRLSLRATGLITLHTFRARRAGRAERRRLPLAPFPDAVALWPGDPAIGGSCSAE
jgi:hypothetical protein